MNSFTRHHQPYPPMTDQTAPGEPGCHAESNDFACTRPYGHDGDHEAGGASGKKYASWPAEQRCPNCAPGYDCESGVYTRPEVTP